MCGDFPHVIVMLKDKFIPVHKNTNSLHGKKIAIGIIHGNKIVYITCICLIHKKCWLVQLCINQNGHFYLCRTGPEFI